MVAGTGGLGVKLPARVTRVPPYLFAELDRRLEAFAQRGVRVLQIAQGDPDLPTPEPIVETLIREARNPRNHRYPSYIGEPELREAIADFMEKRYGVHLDPDREIMVLIGAKEGLAHLAWALVPPEGAVVYPDPGYPTFSVLGTFADARSLPWRLYPEKGYLPREEDLPLAEGPQMWIVNYPHNPTGAVSDRGTYEALLRLARARGAWLVSDAAYAELYEEAPPPSILQLPGAGECAVEVHSFSKTFNMTGWRLGWVAGCPEIWRALYTIKSNVDSGVFRAIQLAGVRALELFDELVPPLREIYMRRRTLAREMLEAVGLEVFPGRGTFYLWVRLPEPWSASGAFVEELLEREHVLVSPGRGYGEQGEGWFRISVTAPEEVLEEALQRIQRFVRGSQ